MSAEDDLRLAWQADRDGRPGRRDALLTLAVAQVPAHTPWVARCRDRLVENRPDHIFARFSSVPEALGHPKVRQALKKLRALYPPAKVANLVRRDEVRRGPWTGRRPALAVVINDLFARRRGRIEPGEPTRVQPKRPRPAVLGSEARARARFALSVLWTVAILMEVVARESASGAEPRAA